jgi:enamine deaminase RidA (YjgF/YER057c/UK114 family)
MYRALEPVSGRRQVVTQPARLIEAAHSGTWIAPAHAGGERTSNPRFRGGSRRDGACRPVGFRVTGYHHAMSTPESHFAALGLDLPPAPPPGGVYRPVVVAGGLAFVSGHGPVRPDRTLITGRVGADLTLDDGRDAARQVGLTILATLRAEFGTLDRVRRVIKLLGMVNATPQFHDHPKVINGCSELFAAIWGPVDGVGARSAVGMGSLPHDIAVEIEGIFELTP